VTPQIGTSEVVEGTPDGKRTASDFDDRVLAHLKVVN